MVCKLLNVKIIVRSNSSPVGWYHNWIKKIIYKKIISLADQVIVNSLEFKNQMETRFKIKAKCIFNPLNLTEIINKSKFRIKEKFYNTGFKIINLGRMTDQKRSNNNTKSNKCFKKKLNIRLLIMGRGIEKNNLIKYVKDNKLKNNVKIINFKDNPYPYIKKADLFILSSRYEGLPNVLLEAAALKIPIISTKCPTGPKEILDNGKGGHFFKMGDYKELSRKIIFCLKNKRELKVKTKHNYQRLCRYDYFKNLNEYYLLVKPLLKR